jgi:hypothetical protein
MNISEVIFVLGPGRSGTSLIMQVLKELGVTISENLIKPRYHNEKGTFEDKEISSYYFRKLFPSVGCDNSAPFDFDSHRTLPGLKEEALDFFEKTLKKNLALAETNQTPWALKHPSTSLILPYWLEAFNRSAVVPRFILALRNPAEVITSRMVNFGEDQATSELKWIVNIITSIRHTAGKLFIIHYEDWFLDPHSVIQELIGYLTWKPSDLDNRELRAQAIISSDLNRSISRHSVLKSLNIVEIYSFLQNYRFSNYDSNSLMSFTAKIENQFHEFSSWYLTLQSKTRKLNELENKINRFENALGSYNSVENLITQNQQLKNYIDKLQFQVDQFLSH